MHAARVPTLEQDCAALSTTLAEARQRAGELELHAGRLAFELEGARSLLAELRAAREHAEQAVRDGAGTLALTQRQLAELEVHAGRVEAERDAALTALGEAKAALDLATRRAHEDAATLETARRKTGELEIHASRLAAELEAARAALLAAQTTLAAETATRAATELELRSLAAGRAELETRLTAERAHTQEKLSLLESARESLVLQFKTLANDVLEEKSQRFAEQNKEGLGALLEPLKAQLADFKGKVESVHLEGTRERSALREQVTQLLGLNQQLSQDAHDLTRALKGSSKAQGNWGELILERVLEQGGLRAGHEYDAQESHTRDDGSRLQPDVVIHLPGDRHLVVDAKVSLVAWEASVSASSDEAREVALGRLVDSLRAHLLGLSGKRYQDLYRLRSLDFVILFVPIEPAYLAAIQREPALWQEAWERNVLLVSPSTLLFVMRTVAHLWRQEQQGRNAQDIARRGAELYDKLAAFVADLQEVGRHLARAQGAHEEAVKKLSTGRGNVLRQAERLRELGVKPDKALPAELLLPEVEEPPGALPSG